MTNSTHLVKIHREVNKLQISKMNMIPIFFRLISHSTRVLIDSWTSQGYYPTEVVAAKIAVQGKWNLILLKLKKLNLRKNRIKWSSSRIRNRCESSVRKWTLLKAKALVESLTWILKLIKMDNILLRRAYKKN